MKTLIQSLTLGSASAFLATLTLSCSGDDDPQPKEQPSQVQQCDVIPTSERCEAAMSDPTRLCGPLADMPFIAGILTGQIDDPAAGALELVEPGQVCMAGTLEPSDWAQMVLSTAPRTADGRTVGPGLDPAALGIVAVRLRLTPPDQGRMTLLADVVMQCECPAHPYECVQGGRYTLGNSDHSAPLRFTEPTTIIAPLADFVPNELSEPLVGHRPIAHFLLELESTEEAFDYEFCVSDVEFLDANGNVVSP